jgi:integrase
MVTSPNTYSTITQLVKTTHVFGHPKVRKKKQWQWFTWWDSKCCWNVSLRHYCYWDIWEQTRFKDLAQALGHKNILTTSNYLQDSAVQYKTN